MKKIMIAGMAGGVWLACALAAGQVEAKPVPLGSSQQNSKAPIEVTSDTLEVFQMENRAVFTGHVIAIQGDVRLKADQMTIYYNPPEEDKADKPKPKAASQDKEQDKGKDAVKKIEATGNVLLTTPEETASGATGIYDVENNMIYLNDNVVLTRGQNVLKGMYLTYNFATGKSMLTSRPGDKAAGSAEPVPGQGKQRVRALFVPEDNQNVTNHKK